MPADILALLRAYLLEFDGRTISMLGEAEAKWRDTPGYVDALVNLTSASEHHIASGASWLIKSYLEQDGAFSPDQSQALLQTLPPDADWSTKLHLSQSIRYLAIPSDSVDALQQWLKPLLTHERPFLRAWSLDALGWLVSCHPRYQADFEAALHRALADSAASVRARARKLA